MYSAQFNSASSTLCFLKPINGVSELYAVDLAPGGVVGGEDGNDSSRVRQVVAPSSGGDTEENLSLEEKLRRERARQLTTGITSFVWWPGRDRVVFPQLGNLLAVDVASSSSTSTSPPSTATPFTLWAKTSGGSAVDPKFSPDGKHLAFVQDGRLLVCNVEGVAGGAAETPLPNPNPLTATVVSAPSKEGVTHGLADYIAAEEFDRFTGYWWSPCGRYIAFQETDDTHIPLFRILHSGEDDPQQEEQHRYPFAGKRNAIVKLGVLDVAAAMSGSSTGASSTVWMDLGPEEDIYLARVTFGPSPASSSATAKPMLCAQIMNRAQDVLDVVAYDISTGKGSLLLRESGPNGGWVNVNDLLSFLPCGIKCPPALAAAAHLPTGGDQPPLDFFLWGTEESGYCHLQMYAYPSKLEGAPRYIGPPKASATSATTGTPSSSSASASSAAAGPDASSLQRNLAQHVRHITGGNWLVESVCHVGPYPSPDGPLCVVFTGTLDGALQRHAYTAPVFAVPSTAELATESFYGIPGCRRITSGAGMHSLVVASNGSVFADALSSLHGPPSLAVYRMDAAARFPGSPAGGARAGGLASPAAALRSPRDALFPSTPLKGGSGAFPSSPMNLRSPAAGTSNAGTEGLPWPLNSIVSFEATGAYGPRMSVGVSLIAIAHNSLPTSSGTPPSFAIYKSQLHSALGLLDATATSTSTHSFTGGVEGAASDLSALASSIAAPVSAAVSNLAAAVSSRIDNLTSSKSTAAGGNTNNSGNANGSGNGAAANGGGGLMGGFSFDSLGSKFASFGVQAGAMLAGMGLPEDEVDLTEQAAPAVTGAKEEAAPIPVPATPQTKQASGASGSSFSVAAAAATTSPATTTTTPVVPPLLVSLPGADGGATTLYAALFLPDPEIAGPGPYPTIISVYGGPHVQRVKHDWTTANEVRAQALRKEGFLVAMVDNRGGSRRGVAFEASIRHRMGTVEVEDQVAAVRALVACGLTDPDKVGLYGWSYGGYMTLMCLAKAPEVFKVGVAGAPVTSWDGYDTGYTERYMGTPASNPIGYEDGSVMTHAGKITGKVLLVHGLLDENVHVRHSYRLMNAMVSKNVPYDFLALAKERHSPRGVEAKAYMEARIREYFKRVLMPGK